ncbi:MULTISPECIES: DUF2470 domain-containing protein [Streptomyces]|uniref:DUF2470 domain-containing protein n=1 Tax=Streptomyces TaxID=1883 RepID=UPI0013AC889E|nr:MULTISPECIES: DUF2470 domain-containing protein [Streptomyces]MBY8865401.1 DUF2470 domain-containing protein [Streptomyces sennicomposti]MYS46249.1 DUF2470 domain-containing protein [Streptomyces sp. SID5998]NED31936.1 DUF2470 domain-containing protein [Streptomyces sp. SID8499]
MRRTRSRAIAPTAAERVRSVLAAAHSLTVVSDGAHTEVRRLDDTGAMGHFHLHAPSEDPVVRPSGRVPVRLELTDVAPTPVRERLRARVTITGLLGASYDPEQTESTCVEFGQAVLEDERGRTFLTLPELEAAPLDPLAPYEAGMLTHLADDHGALVPLLLRLVRPAPAPGVRRVLPVRIDRYGLTLRLEYPRTHRDVRLPFRAPVRHIDHVGPQIHGLLATARRLSHTGRLPA